MTEEKIELPHKLTLNQRKNLSVTGVTEVVSFEPEGAVLRTAQGLLLVQGQQLKLKALSRESGQVEITGEISALSYQQQRTGGTLRRLFG